MLTVPLRFSLRWLVGERRPARCVECEGDGRFDLLVEAHLDAIYRTARRVGVREDDVEDLVQEVLVVLARRLSDIEVDKERAFALGTTVRLAASFRRQVHRRREALMEEVDGTEGIGPLSMSLGPCAERRVEQGEALAVLRAGLDAMSEPQRVTFVLFELEELRASEIAAQLGIAEAAVVSRLHRARNVMRRICGRHGFAATVERADLDEENQP
jgi:RNA polymerase sigma-70 factor, ECF subfamily